MKKMISLSLSLFVVIAFSTVFSTACNTDDKDTESGISNVEDITMGSPDLNVMNGVVTNGPDSRDTNAITEVEIREYQGENLSSVNDFRENSIKGPQYIDLEEYTLKITGLVDQELEYTFNDVVSNYESQSKIVTLYCVEGWSAKILWEGVLVSDILAKAGVSPEATVVIFHAYDGYTTSLPVDYILDQDITLAHKMNDMPLLPERGAPFQLVAESKWGYKWIKWVTEIELSDNTDYEGFWESRGYSNKADLDGPFRGD